MESLFDSLDWILWELFILNHKVMQVISKVVRTSRASMPVKYSKEADLWPLDVYICLVLWLKDVENDRDSILIIVSDDPLVGIGCIGFYYSAFLL